MHTADKLCAGDAAAAAAADDVHNSGPMHPLIPTTEQFSSSASECWRNPDESVKCYDTEYSLQIVYHCSRSCRFPRAAEITVQGR